MVWQQVVLIFTMHRQICDYPTWDEIKRWCHLHVVFICFVPETGTRFVIMNVLVTMHQRQDSTTPGHGISIHQSRETHPNARERALGNNLAPPLLLTNGRMVAPDLAHVVVRCAPPLIPIHQTMLALSLDLETMGLPFA